MSPMSSDVVHLDPLLEALSGHELIMHGADYDLRLLRKHHEFVPRAIFDTMLAARLLGVRQFGLGHLVEQYLGVKLEKGPQKANWALRPLTERMECYARNDTRYLKPLADRLQRELQASGRLPWQQESCARLIRDSTTHRPPDLDAIWRIRGSHLLKRAGPGHLARAMAVAGSRGGGRRTNPRFSSSATRRWSKSPLPPPSPSPSSPSCRGTSPSGGVAG